MVDGSVIGSAEAAGVPHGALAEMLRAFSWDVNFQHDIKAGDRFDVLVERSWTSDGIPADDGRVLWAELTTGGGAERYSIYRFKPRDGEEFFYNLLDSPLRTILIVTPVKKIMYNGGMAGRHMAGAISEDELGERMESDTERMNRERAKRGLPPR